MQDLKSLRKYKVLLAPIRYGAGVKGYIWSLVFQIIKDLIRKITDSWAHGLPVVTTPLGAEGLFEETFNNNKEYRKINLKSDFYNDEVDISNTPQTNQDMISYYKYDEKHRSFHEKLNFGGYSNNYSVEEIANSAIKLYSNQKEWEKAVDVGTKILKNRMSFQMNERLFLKTIGKAQAEIVSNRKKNHLQSLVWSETLRSHDKLLKYLVEKNKNKLKEWTNTWLNLLIIQSISFLSWLYLELHILCDIYDVVNNIDNDLL